MMSVLCLWLSAENTDCHICFLQELKKKRFKISRIKKSSYLRKLIFNLFKYLQYGNRTIKIVPKKDRTFFET